jgi:hypothetical protein
MAFQLQRYYRYLIPLFLSFLLGSPFLYAGSDSNSTSSTSSGTTTVADSGSSSSSGSSDSNSSTSGSEEKPPDFTKMAYQASTGMTYPALVAARTADIAFPFTDPKCCCNKEIMALFTKDTIKIVSKLNPATDLFVGSVRHLMEANYLTKKKIKNLKIIVGLYSYKDLYFWVQPNVRFEADVKQCKKTHGCEAVDLNTKEGQEKYLNVIDCFENGGSYTGKAAQSSAWGRYQFTADTGARYCKKAGCCAGWRSSPSCQDKMFALFTADNARLLAHKNIPINTCTLYMAHQQGAGGLGWLYGGKNPYRNFSKLKDAIKKNVGPKTWAKAEAAGLTNSEEGLRKVFSEFWSKKFGGDIMANVGTATAPGVEGIGGVTGQVYGFYQKIQNWRLYYREGILKEQYEENHHLNNMATALHLRNSINVVSD